jgi:Flp pilus assembly protein TadG
LRTIRGKDADKFAPVGHRTFIALRQGRAHKAALSSGLFMPFARFLHDRRASIVPMLALALVPLVGAVAAAVDYSRANAVRTAMRSALDSAALMLSKDAQTLTIPDLGTRATGYFTALFTQPEASNVKVRPEMTSPQEGSFLLTLTASASVNTTFTRVLGQSAIEVAASTEVVWGIRKLELALVLDNTGSMASSGKMEALKTAAHTLLLTLQTAAKTPGDVKVSIVPFDTTVNVGSSYKAEPWFDWTYLDCNGSLAGTGCGPTPADLWNGCVMDRTQSYDIQDTPPSAAAAATLYPAVQCGSLAAAMPLTYDWIALNTRIDAMTPAGSTNTTIGLVWGWHALTANAPFTEGSAPQPDREKVIVLLTDGENTKNRWTTSSNSIDGRTERVCANIKAANIKIYTVRVINGDAALLRGCASKPDMYYDVLQASQLNNAFSAIAQNLANLRIVK